MRRGHLHVRQERHVVAVPRAREVGAQVSLEIGALARGAGELGLVGRVREEPHAVAFEEGFLIREGAGLVVRVGDLARLHLGLFHIGLVERIDADERAGHRGGELPAEELAAHPAALGEDHFDDRMSGLFLHS